MNDHDQAAAPDDMLLSSYLDGDLDEQEAAALEARLAREPDLARQLDDLAALLVTLRGLDEVTPPEGYEERLRARLAAEREVVPLEAARSRRRLAWTSFGAVAAAVAAVAVLSMSGALQGTGPQLALDGAPEGDMEAFSAPAGEDAAGDGGDAGAEADSALEEERAEAPARAVLPAPVLVDSTRPLEDSASVGVAFSGLPETDALLGTPVEEGRDLAAAYRVAIQRAEAFPSGPAPAACLDVVTGGGGDRVLVPARVETVTYQDAPALAYVLVRGRAGSNVLDRVEVWIVDAATCATREFHDVTPS